MTNAKDFRFSFDRGGSRRNKRGRGRPSPLTPWAAKADLAEVKAELKSDIAVVKSDLAEVKAELKADIAALEAGLYRHLWVVAAGIVGLTVSLTVALVKLTS